MYDPKPYLQEKALMAIKYKNDEVFVLGFLNSSDPSKDDCKKFENRMKQIDPSGDFLITWASKELMSLSYYFYEEI